MTTTRTLILSALIAQLLPGQERDTVDRLLLKSGRSLVGAVIAEDSLGVSFDDVEIGRLWVARTSVRATIRHDREPDLFAAEAPDTAGDEPDGYIRWVAPAHGRPGALATATTRWHHAATDSTLFLVGAVHIADPIYYQELQRILDSTDLVLFEGVGRGGAASDDDVARFDLVLRMQLLLEGVLGLTFQKDGVDYRRAFWRNSDVDLAELKAEMAARKTGLPTDNPMVQALLGAVTSVIDPTRVGRRPGAALHLKRQFAPLLAQADRVLQQPGLARMRHVLIEFRNEAVMRDLAEELEHGVRGRWLSIFYGAAHLPDFAQRLRASGWTFQGAAWQDAWSVPAAEPPTTRAAEFAAAVDDVSGEHGSALAVSVWLGDATGTALYERDAGEWRAAASSIKTAILIELFAQHADALDDPWPGAAAILADPHHPALAPFPGDALPEIRRALAGLSVRRLGQAMIHGVGISNLAYNAAANVAIAVLGGPEELTRRIRARAPAFDGAAVRRYMLAKRDDGDNEATARTLGEVLCALASRRLRGVEPRTMAAIRDCLYSGEGPHGRHFSKGGALDSDPMTRIATGFHESGDRTLVYVVMCEAPGLAGSREVAAARLARTCSTLTERLVGLVLPAGR